MHGGRVVFSPLDVSVIGITNHRDDPTGDKSCEKEDYEVYHISLIISCHNSKRIALQL